MIKLDKILDVLHTLTKEIEIHNSELYDPRRRNESLENKLESMVSSGMYMYTPPIVLLWIVCVAATLLYQATFNVLFVFAHSLSEAYLDSTISAADSGVH